MKSKNAHIDKAIKSKDIVRILKQELLESKISIKDIISHYETLPDKDKGNYLEAIEYASKVKPELITKDVFKFAIACLKEKHSRIKWESAKIIGNSAHLLPDLSKVAIQNLTENALHPGTVVRWASAYALCQIAQLSTRWQKELTGLLKSIEEREEKNSIKKIYRTTLKAIK